MEFELVYLIPLQFRNLTIWDKKEKELDLELKDFEQNELELELHEKELSIWFLCDTNALLSYKKVVCFHLDPYLW